MVSHIGYMLQYCIDLMVDVIAKVADGIATKGLFYLNLSSEVLNRTSSYVWQMVFAYVSVKEWIVDPNV